MSPERKREAATVLRSLAVWEDCDDKRKRMCFLAELLEAAAIMEQLAKLITTQPGEPALKNGGMT